MGTVFDDLWSYDRTSRVFNARGASDGHMLEWRHGMQWKSPEYLPRGAGHTSVVSQHRYCLCT